MLKRMAVLMGILVLSMAPVMAMDQDTYNRLMGDLIQAAKEQETTDQQSLSQKYQDLANSSDRDTQRSRQERTYLDRSVPAYSGCQQARINNQWCTVCTGAYESVLCQQ